MSDHDLHSLPGIQALLDTSPIHRLLGFRAVSVPPVTDPVLLVIAAPAGGNAERAEGAGQAHGGAIATLIDTTATFAASRAVDHVVPTMNLQVNYLRPAAGAELTATAMVRRVGRTVAIVDVEIESGGKLVAIGRATLATGV